MVGVVVVVAGVVVAVVGRWRVELGLMMGGGDQVDVLRGRQLMTVG